MIQILSWVAMAGVVLTGLVVLATVDGVGKVAGLGYLLLGPLVIRVYTEVILLGFKIHESVNEIRKDLSKTA